MRKVFNDEKLIPFINKYKEYKTNPEVEFIKKDFAKKVFNNSERFDLLISLYAGLISMYCKENLKINGILVTNNSHGDASIAFTDNCYKLIGVFKRKN